MVIAVEHDIAPHLLLAGMTFCLPTPQVVGREVSPPSPELQCELPLADKVDEWLSLIAANE